MELFHPVAETFVVTGNLTEPAAETATLLPNGNVPITRSFDFGVRNRADLYDPNTGTFTRTADLTGPYQGFGPSATLLANGKGADCRQHSGTPWRSRKAQLHDPISRSFSQTTEMMTDLDMWLAAVLLPVGRVLVAVGSSYAVAGAAELYDPVPGAFAEPIRSQSAEGHTTALFPDGTVLPSGGWICCGYTIGTAEIYTPTASVPSPVLLSLPDSGEGAILHAATHQVISAANPLTTGEALEIYLTSLIDASVIPPHLAIGGRAAQVLWFGNTPGFPGLNQINVRVPTGIVPAPTVPVRLQYMGPA
jgi:hypothetical protein